MDHGGRRGRDESREQRGDIHTPRVRGRARAVFRDNLEGRDGLGGGREAQEGGDTWMPTADSPRCLAETSTIS